MTQDHPARFAVVLVVCAALLASCSDEPAQQITAEPIAQPAWLPGTYAGTFPCVDCPGIEIGLWLRSDGTFFYRQNYLAADEQDAAGAFYAMGQWRWDALTGQVALNRDGPTRWFEALAENTLRFRTNAKPDHLLVRQEVDLPFEYVVTLEGEYQSAKVQRFTECRTGLGLSIVEKGEGRRIRRQYRSMPRGQPIIAVVEGRILTAGDGNLALSIERLVTLKPGERCVNP
jgi:copper homeostasis protein (lipoprotein)